MLVKSSGGTLRLNVRFILTKVFSDNLQLIKQIIVIYMIDKTSNSRQVASLTALYIR